MCDPNQRAYRSSVGIAILGIVYIVGLDKQAFLALNCIFSLSANSNMCLGAQKNIGMLLLSTYNIICLSWQKAK